MAPPGTKVLIHETPQQRHTWDIHGKEGWYIGTSPLHYRCYHIYITETRGERTAKTVQSPPQSGDMPDMPSTVMATDVARHLDKTFSNPSPAVPFAHFGAQTIDAIQQLSNIIAATGTPTHQPQGAPAQLYSFPCCRATLTPKHLQGCFPQCLHVFQQGHPWRHQQGWIPQHTTHLTGTPFNHVHKPNIQLRPQGKAPSLSKG